MKIQPISPTRFPDGQPLPTGHRYPSQRKYKPKVHATSESFPDAFLRAMDNLQLREFVEKMKG